MGFESLLTENAPNAVMLGAAVWVLWQKVSAIDDHTSQRLEEIRQNVESLAEEARERNGRLSALERWKAAREGYRDGWEDHETQVADG